MKYGVQLPQFEDFGDVHTLLQLAQDAEDAGWDGFFLWDHMIFDDLFHRAADPWIALAAIAVKTSRIRIGTLVTPVARRRPWKLARETATWTISLAGG